VPTTTAPDPGTALVGVVMLLAAPLIGLWFVWLLVSGRGLGLLLPFGLLRLLMSRMFLLLVLLALLLGYLAANVDPPEGLWRHQQAPTSPPIARQKQDGHVKGTPQYRQRLRQGKPTSTWDDPGEADPLTREAWKKGTPVPGRPHVRDYDVGRRVGSDPQGQPQTKIRVSEDAHGRIHGWPSGPPGRGEQ
jgi:hypothetical protein